MGYFKEQAIEQMGHDLDDPFLFLKAQAARAERAAARETWWTAERDELSPLVDKVRKNNEFAQAI